MSTYLFNFDGEQLFYNDRPLIRLSKWATLDQNKIFDNLFKPKSELYNIFSDCFEDVHCHELLGCKFNNGSNPKKRLKQFVSHYLHVGSDVFFLDIDATWKNYECNAYTFVRSDDVPKLLTIMKSASNIVY